MNGALNWSVGDDLEELVFPPIGRLQFIKYAGASGDYNPIHLIDEADQEAGLPGVIAHGMLTVATMDLLFSPYLEHGYVKYFGSRFSGLVFVGDELRVGGWVAGAETTDEGRLYTSKVYARKGEETVATATAWFLVYEL